MSRFFLLCALIAIPFALFESSLRAQDAATSIRLVSDPALSPDGSRLAFSWRGDIWIAPSTGGAALPLTRHPASDRRPVFSPDGKRVAFTTTREGESLLMSLAVEGNDPQIHGRHSEGYRIQQWVPQGLFGTGRRDHFWRHADRPIIRPLDAAVAETVLCDANCDDPSLSPDGRLMLYTREGTRTWRKGYRGAQESQVWLYDFANKAHRLLHEGEGGSRYPRWVDRGRYIYASAKTGTFNLQLVELESGKSKPITSFEDDGTMFPTVSIEGSKVVFRRGFDLHHLNLETMAVRKIDLTSRAEVTIAREARAVLKTASGASLSEDAREIAFVSGGDLWVMDTVLREPVRVLDSPEEERYPLFVGNDTLLVTSDVGGRTDIWRVEREDPKLPFWRNTSFKLEAVTKDDAVERSLKRVPGGKAVSFIVDRGDLCTINCDGSDRKVHLQSWNVPQYAFSPDGSWLAYSVQDDDFNADIWLKPVDGSRAPFNLSCHPDNDRNPTWSKDGKILAFTGRRWSDESDIVYVYLEKDRAEETARERKLEKALKKMKERDKKKKGKSKKKADSSAKDASKSESEDSSEKKGEESPKKDEKKAEKKPLEIDFEGIRDRLRRIRNSNSFESGLIFSPTEDRLYFRTSINGKSGYYSVEFPDKLTPKFFATDFPRGAVAHKEAKKFSGIVSGVPAVTDFKGKTEKFTFSARQVLELGPWCAAVFDQAWRAMKVGFYDGRFGNKDWDAVRTKYRAVAEQCLDSRSLSEVGNMMLGELNGSHLGFSMRSFQPSYTPTATWRITTGHLGARYDSSFEGPGWKVAEVIRDTPAWREKSRLAPGDVILSIDGRPLTRTTAPASVLNGPGDRWIELEVKSADGKTRKVAMQPTTYGSVRSRLYEAWLDFNRNKVEELSDGRFGYLHIRAMSGPNLQRFDAELYRIGAGKDGLVIDVRENGGGSITDHLLTCLCQPTHAITRPRGGGEGYPHDRRIYATWDKPIVVLCNQNSFSNAEIFAHAVKTLKRGRVVGVQTAGGVISTGRARLMGGASVRMPFRGWYLLDGEDMELNGAKPHVEIWPKPGEWPAGIDRQMEAAVKLLAEDVAEWKARPRPKLRRASER